MNGKPFPGSLCVMPLVCAGAVALWVLSYQGQNELPRDVQGLHFSHVSKAKSAGVVKEWSASVWDGQVLVGFFEEKLKPEGTQTAEDLERATAARVGWHSNYRPLCQEPVLGFTLFGDLDSHPTNYYSPVVQARVVSEAYGIVGIPLWLVVAGSGGLWAAQLLVWVKRHGRKKPGCCRACGYDLRGNVSGVCPECGGEVKESGAKEVRDERVWDVGEARVSFA